jgi:periplasmic protein TonB
MSVLQDLFEEEKKEEILSYESDSSPHSHRPEVAAGPGVGLDLNESMLEANHMQKPRSWVDVLVSVLAHTGVVLALILIPLMYTQAIDMPGFVKTFLIAPPPPPPPPPVAKVIAQPLHRVQTFFHEGQLYSPKVIPRHVAVIKEQPLPQQSTGGVPGGVIGGVPGGRLGGVLGGILSGRNTMVVPPPPPKPVMRRGPIRVGGRVQAPQVIYRVQPVYPPLARQARISGEVVIDSVIDAQGNVTQMKVVSGPPLLIQPAMNALSQWKYRPTLLNGTPVAVEMLVTIHFQMND